MPVYPYRCKKCRKRFDVTMTVREHETRKVRCPKCKSTAVTQQVAGFFAQTSSKS